jgi:hypothetical protein
LKEESALNRSVLQHHGLGIVHFRNIVHASNGIVPRNMSEAGSVASALNTQPTTPPNGPNALRNPTPYYPLTARCHDRGTVFMIPRLLLSPWPSEVST